MHALLFAIKKFRKITPGGKVSDILKIDDNFYIEIFRCLVYRLYESRHGPLSKHMTKVHMLSKHIQNTPEGGARGLELAPSYRNCHQFLDMALPMKSVASSAQQFPGDFHLTRKRF